MAGISTRSNVWTIDVMQPYLVDKLSATNEEINYLKRLYALKLKTPDASIKRQGPRRPSTIIDNFLYHGDLGHAQNMSLLNELGIQHIVNVCDHWLSKEITDQFHVLWIKPKDELSADIRQHFNQTNRFLNACKQKGEKVLVHCQMGISRSSTIVLAYLLKYGVSSDFNNHHFFLLDITMIHFTTLTITWLDVDA